LERLLETVPVARALGAPLLVFHVSSLRFAAADAAVRARARAWDRERVQALAERAGEWGMEVALENASHPEHPAYLLELCRTLERLLETVPVARALGAPLLVFHVSSLRFAAADAAVRARARAWDRERVQALAERAGEWGMEVALENASHPEHPAYLLELCRTL